MVRQAAGWLARKFWGTLALSLILAAVLVQIGRELAPHLTLHRDYLTSYLSERLGARVELAQLSARWEGLKPELVVGDFRLYNPAGQPVLAAERVALRLDMLNSVVSRSLRFDEARFGGLQAELQQSAAGVWGLQGIERKSQPDQEFSDPLDMFFLGREIELTNTQVAVTFAGGERRYFKAHAITLENDGQFHRFVASIGHQQQLARLIFEGRGNPRELDEFQGRGYLLLQQFQTGGLMELTDVTFPGQDYFRDGVVGAELWFAMAPQQPMTVTGRWSFENAARVGTAAPETQGLPSRLSSELEGTYSLAGEWRLGMRQLFIQWPEAAEQTLDLSVSRRVGSGSIELALSQLDLASFSRQLQSVALLPEKARDLLQQLALTGELQQLQLSVPTAQPQDFRARARLRDLGVAAWKGVPRLAQVSGYLEAGLLSGMVALEAPDGFEMEFPGIYQQPFRFDRASGRVAWQVDREANRVSVNSGVLSMQSELGRARGAFYLDAPLERNSRPLELTLQVGLRDGRVTDHARLVPQVVPDSLRSWLQQALQGGSVPSGGFVMNGFFGAGASHARAVQLALNVVDGELDYHPDWPAAGGVEGLVLVDDRQVHATITGGQMLGAQLQTTQVDTSPSAQGGTLLSVRGTAQGPAQTGLDILALPVLQQRIGDAMSDWRAEGRIEASVALVVPLAPAEQDSQQQDVQVQLQGVDLFMDGPGLEFNQLRGDLTFTNRKGLSASSLRGQFWGQPLQASISSRWQPEAQSTRVNFTGKLAVERLMRWSRRPELSFVTGLTDVTGAAIIRSGQPLQLEFASSLQGATVALPEPYGKAAADARKLSVSAPVSADSFTLKLNYDDLLGLHYVQSKAAGSGDIALGGGAVAELRQRTGARGEPGLRVSGSLDRFDVQEWWQVLQRYQQQTEAMAQHPAAAAGEVTAAAEAPVLSLDVRLGTLRWGALDLADVGVSGGNAQDVWRIQLDDDKVKGGVILAAGAEPLQLDLEYVRWVTQEAELGSESANGDSWLGRVVEGIDIASLPSVRFSVGEVTLNGETFGNWKGDFHSDHKGLHLTGVVGSVRGLQVSGVDEQGAKLSWQPAGRSRLRALLSGEELEDVAKAWKMPAIFDAAQGAASVDLNWPGDPLSFDLVESRGKLDFNMRKGRFYKTTGQASDAFLRLVGLFNFDSWVRRLQLDFSDVYKSGTPFDKVSGELRLDQGMLYLSSPFEVTNSSSRLQMGGKVNLRKETLDASLVATLPAGGNATLITAMAAGLPAAAGVYLVSKLFAKQVDRVASVSYRITGSWSDPDVRFDRLFDNRSAEKAAKENRKRSEEEPR